MTPKAPPYDALEWARKPFPEKARLVCQAWAIQGYGSPLAIYLVYALKVAAYVAGWVFFCSFTPGLGAWNTTAWWWQPVAFQKAIAWSMLFEVLGLGCGSGPLTGRYLPPIGGVLYFLRPNTTKLPWFEGAPVIGSSTRRILDVGLYAALLVALVSALLHPAPGLGQWLPIVLLVPLLGILDKTIFLAARSEHYWVTTVMFASDPQWVAGAQAVQLAIWFFAGVSKLNHHFPTVVCVMASNGPLTPFGWVRRAMYQRYPDDLNPSRVAATMAHMGAALEFGVPTALFTGVMLGSYEVVVAGLVLMVLLHVYITSNVPMGVPIEWNFMVVYSGFFLFGANWHTTPLDVGSAPVGLFLVIWTLAIPLLGNLKPAWISFLLAMRYYAGNWPCSVWLFKGEAGRKLDRLTKTSPWIYDQLSKLYDKELSVGVVGKVMAFRLMHLHGRAFQILLPKAVDRTAEEYEWLDGELVAGLALGYNFGDGHLHKEQLLRSIQAQCGFEEGELRVIMLEAQPLGQPTLAYRIHDAKTGLLDAGEVDIRDLRRLQPWPVAEPA